MTMARQASEIDRLIEEGLVLYGRGDLDGALVNWERALAIDPENAQAVSYVDYVRANYDVLTSQAAGDETTRDAPFGIADDEPEYQIEIQPGELRASAPSREEMGADPADEGWNIEADRTDDGTRSAGARIFAWYSRVASSNDTPSVVLAAGSANVSGGGPP